MKEIYSKVNEQPLPKPPLTGAELITQERERQMSEEGWDAEHDDVHTNGELALVAALYATPIPLFSKVNLGKDQLSFIDPWPWFDTVEVTRYGDGLTTQVPAWDKRKKHSKLRKLVIAGALIAAEIDRLQRAEARGNEVAVEPLIEPVTHKKMR